MSHGPIGAAPIDAAPIDTAPIAVVPTPAAPTDAAPVAVSAAEGYALWAETWDATPSPIAALEHRALLPWIEEWIAELHPRRAIDVGCGTGRWTARLSALGRDGLSAIGGDGLSAIGGDGLSALGFDASSAMLAVAARKPGLRGRLALADAAALPIASRAAGLVLCALTFGHIRNQAGALAEFARILEPGGVLILTDFHPAAAAQGWRRTFRRDGQVYELENHPYTLHQLRDMAPGLSLRDSAEATIGEPERALFHRAGRPDLFLAACATPAVLLTRWLRQA